MTTINVSNKGITSLKGLEYFRRITELDCHNNSISSLNLKDYGNLSYLCCYGNKLSSLDISNLSEMPRDWDGEVEYNHETFVVPESLFRLILPQETVEEIIIIDKKEYWFDKYGREEVPIDSDMYHELWRQYHHYANYQNNQWKWILK